MNNNTAQPKTVLIVEDETSLLTSLQTKLDREEFIVKTAQNGEKAWEIIQNDPIDLAIVDMVIPQKDGEWLVSKIRESEKYTFIPIIILTNLTHGVKLNNVSAR